MSPIIIGVALLLTGYVIALHIAVYTVMRNHTILSARVLSMGEQYALARRDIGALADYLDLDKEYIPSNKSGIKFIKRVRK